MIWWIKLQIVSISWPAPIPRVAYEHLCPAVLFVREVHFGTLKKSNVMVFGPVEQWKQRDVSFCVKKSNSDYKEVRRKSVTNYRKNPPNWKSCTK